MLVLNFSFLVSNGHTDTTESTSRRASRVDSPPDTPKTVCCCSLNTQEYEVDNCFPTQRCCCSRFEDTTCHVIWMCVRHNVKCLVEHKYFEWFIVFLIAASSIALVSEFFFEQDLITVTLISLCYITRLTICQTVELGFRLARQDCAAHLTIMLCYERDKD